MKLHIEYGHHDGAGDADKKLVMQAMNLGVEYGHDLPGSVLMDMTCRAVSSWT